jgi:cell division protein FtsB
MLQKTQQMRDVEPGNARLREELARLRKENERLRRENRDLRMTLDVHISRARSPALFGPVEMTAGTSVGPRRAQH